MRFFAFILDLIDNLFVGAGCLIFVVVFFVAGVVMCGGNDKVQSKTKPTEQVIKQNSEIKSRLTIEDGRWVIIDTDGSNE
jgi:hypothetical protein